MTKIIFCVILLLLVPQLFLSSPLDRALVAVDNPAPGTVARLLAADIMVVCATERYLLVAATEDERLRMDGLGVGWETLDAHIAGKTYYTVDVADDVRRDRIRTSVRFLRYDRFGAVVVADPARITEIAGEGVEIARIFIRPIRLSPVDKPPPASAPAQADPAIEAMVDSVSTSMIDNTVLRLQNFGTRFSARDSCGAARDYIKGRFLSFGIDSVYLDDWSPTYKENVVAVIPGVVDRTKIVVIGGHYDSVSWDLDDCPGADDNASGTSGVIECARVLSNYQFDYTVVFIAFCAEELGLLGSEAYALAAEARGDDIIGMINIDMIGYVAPNTDLDLDIIDNESSEWLRDLVMSVGALYVPELPLVDGVLPGSASSDHVRFWQHGFDAIMFFEDSKNHSPWIHTPDDRVGTSYQSPELAVRSVKLGVALLATMARPFVVGINHIPLANTEDSQNPYRVVADISAAGTLNPDSIFVRYHNGIGVFTEVMTPSGVGDAYEAYIPTQPGGTTVDYYIVAENTEGYRVANPLGAPSEMHRFTVGVESVVFEDDFETDKGWTVGDIDDDATTGVWERVDPIRTVVIPDFIQPEDDHTPDPGVMCYITANAPEFSDQSLADVDNGKTTLFSPVFDLSSHTNAWLRYYRWYTNDTDVQQNPVTDQWVVDVSADNGQSWVRIETLTDSDRSWRLVERNLRDYISLTSNVQLRFIASDDSTESVVEAGVDDFSIFTYVGANTGIGDGTDAPASVSLAQNFPNPFNPETTIRVYIDGPAQVASLVVYDVAGRRVATLLDNQPVAGEVAVRWDGRDDDGKRVTTGVYFYRLDTGEKSLSRKLVVLR